jgi:hypothetical protein
MSGERALVWADHRLLAYLNPGVSAVLKVDTHMSEYR